MIADNDRLLYHKAKEEIEDFINVGLCGVRESHEKCGSPFFQKMIFSKAKDKLKKEFVL